MAASRSRQHTYQRQTTYEQASRHRGRGSDYVYDSTARDLQVKQAMAEAPRRRLSHTARKNREKARHMNLGYVLFLSAALGLTGFLLTGYIQLQAELTASMKRITKLESELNNLRLENNEELSRIESSVDLGEIKRIAMEELGMTYAEEGQIVVYSSAGSDYVRQVSKLPD